MMKVMWWILLNNILFVSISQNSLVIIRIIVEYKIGCSVVLTEKNMYFWPYIYFYIQKMNERIMFQYLLNELKLI